MKIVPVILCGGVGSRLWPLSRATYPKQFLEIFSKKQSLFAKTIKRVKTSFFDKPIIVCNQQYEFKVREELAKNSIEPMSIILEPEGRNTTAAIALAALYMQENNLKNRMLVLPADHFIEKFEILTNLLAKVNEHITDELITFGIRPTTYSTAYGYIKKSDNKISEDVFYVEEFVEKPNLSKAKEYVSSGKYFWNSGIFLLTPKGYLSELEKYKPSILDLVQLSYNQSHRINKVILPLVDLFLKIEDISIDYAVLEKSKQVCVCPIDISWSDVGSWDSISKVSSTDVKNNTIIGDVLNVESENSFVYSEDKLTAIVGIKDLIVISSKDAVLVVSKKDSEKVKKIVTLLKESKRKEHLEHLKIYRPWGYYEDIDRGEKFRAKRIVVSPKKKLSLQLHHHRSEHWVVVKGEAEIVVGDKKRVLNEGESTFIPKNTKHRLGNKRSAPLEIVEVQIGGYLEEDDIVRFEDEFGRV
ncbi:MAG: mannose-1-phosphate guanylyltransferase/mannose-6-phosphate isomerase [Rickettsiales bacterium]